MELRIFGDPVAFHCGPFPVTETMLTSTLVTCVLIGLVWGVRISLQNAPLSYVSIVASMIVESCDKLIYDITGRAHPELANWSGSLFLFIASCNLAGQLPGVHPATGSLATTSALALLVFLSVPFAGIYSHGVCGYLRSYLRPNPLMLPLHVISELSRTLALAVRLFGNIMSGHLVVALLVSLAGLLVPTPIMALDLLIGILQAYIFAILATVYIGAAISKDAE
ncbi:MAG: F0F1 ATP synthase subunit A [Planctomycetales bacterium]|nr:F0F1 ATP synthase subunit A [Planctomycetales bacterium]